MELFSQETDPKLNLSQRILKVDKNILLNQNLYKDNKDPFLECYKNSSKLRKEFHKDFLPHLDSNLGFPSSKEYYKYEDFFKEKNYPKFDLADNYFYDYDLNLFDRNNSPSNANKEKINKKKKKLESESENYYEKSVFFDSKNKSEEEFIGKKSKIKFEKNKKLNKEEDTNYNDKKFDNSDKFTISDNLGIYENKVNNEKNKVKLKDSLNISSINSYKNTSSKDNKNISNNKDNNDNNKKKAYFSKRIKNIKNKE